MLPFAPRHRIVTPAAATDEANRQRMVTLLSALAPDEGLHPTALDGVRLRRADRRIARTPVLYEPSIYIVASGRKKGYVGDRCLVYDRHNYLVLSAPLPFECEAEVRVGEPLLALTIRLEIATIGELASSLEARPAEASVDALSCVHATPLDSALTDAAVRLLDCLRSPVDAAVLGAAIQREITYRVLCGPRGGALLAMLGRPGHAPDIHTALRQIHANYADPVSVADLARAAGMSLSAFHQHFKAVTSSSPLQYVKAVRLHKARLLIVHDRLGAAAAAYRVGYESASQFSREFKRFFGRTPLEESRRGVRQLLH